MRYSALGFVTAFALIASPATPGASLGATALSYRISVAGIGIGDLDLAITRDAGRYAVSAEGSYRVMFWSGAIRGEAEGLIEADGPAPERFEISDDDDDPSRTRIDFDPTRGPVAWQRIPPAPAEWTAGRLDLRDDHLAGALDPISALTSLAFVGAPVSPDALCDRELRVFTGFVVFRLDLDGVRSRSSDRVSCNTRYRPLSGHRADSSSVDRLSVPDAIEASFLAHPSGTWVPERISLPTRVGTLALSIDD
ncbi:MAG: hypothetical protein AAGF76_11625 [Pseudomonadota bacterium]